MSHNKNPWQTLSRRICYDNPWIRVEEHQVLNPAGKPGIYGKVSFKNQAVGIIAADNLGNITLVGQFRYTLERYSWEIPEGGSPADESPLESAKRELQEETGLTATHWSELMRLHLSNSVSDEEAIIFLAEDLQSGEAMPEETEQLMLRKVPFKEALRLVMEGEITDAMSVAAILKLACRGGIKPRIEMVYQDQYLVIVNKPSGLLVHRTAISNDREFLLQYVRDQIGRSVHPVHRLDRPTSGLVIFALQRELCRKFTQLFAEQRIEKSYLALVRGYVDNKGIIDYPLNNSVHNGNGELQPAKTEYQCLAMAEIPFAIGPHPTSRYSLVRIKPHSGRTHQIRRHFAHLRHPLIGDTMHGDGRHNRFFREHFGCRRLMLMADRLAFPHPVTGKQVTASIAVDNDFQQVLEELGIDPAVTQN